MIEVGEYVRTKTGKIRKIVEKLAQYYLIEKVTFDEIVNGNDTAYEDEDIVNHSKSIIELIEVGDYVNGYRVLERKKIKNKEMHICILKDNNCSNWRNINEKTLKSIVTREQYASMEYRVKEE